ncbi:Carboxypeptidase S1 [Tolypocladium ophioglossoides CBS 100239]|uniref:Carboxypeptidase S1 n=1 Tax=Tolypocladium ophioglossoides (strain CBS 100239) TaxID=1163406 RepID=A0A0L0NE56_TOLOC|nr:Carboxypeptidase S1 [Tolypocladium ophioglossoides CBS 100239]
MLTSSLLLGGIAGLAAAQFPPKPQGVTVLKSRFHENVTISFKEPNICETTPGVRSYAGHVHLPEGFLEDVHGEKQAYPVNTCSSAHRRSFFWFFEARKDPANAPLAIWLNGGPGGSSFTGLLQENGPCFVADDSRTTVLNPWSWNNEVNMLYVDEPNQVGLSYDTPTNVTVFLGGDDLRVVPTDFSQHPPRLNLTARAGTLSSQAASHTANSTAQAAHALWHFAQTFLGEFPHYRPRDDRISLWAESYGGHYGPGFMRFFQQQNERIANGTAEVAGARHLHLDTLGIVNGLLDAVVQAEAYIEFPFNNTYGIQAFNQSVYAALMHNFTRPGGCRDQMLRCQEALRGLDVAAVNRNMASPPDDCGIEPACDGPATRLYQGLDVGWFDIGHPRADPFPPPHMHGYMADAAVLGALGSPVNFSAMSGAVVRSFAATHDEVHGGFLDAVAYLLDAGVKVHLVYGDRDYACNWLGGEQASRAVPYSRAADFARAGYAPLRTAGGAVAGMTRQLGNYSFTRVFQAGHEVPMYQPAAAYDIFMRATFNRDIPTGRLPVADELATAGPPDTWHIKNVPPRAPPPKCYVLAPDTCTPDVWEKVEAGEVEVKDYFVVGEGHSGEYVGEL